MGAEADFDEIIMNMPKNVATRITCILEDETFTSSRTIYLGGSWASGTASVVSDVDLFVIAPVGSGGLSSRSH
ncbi:MAG: nucleotidyltransferase domain-containing protein [Candidatus Thorarchaeota archaeon]